VVKTLPECRFKFATIELLVGEKGRKNAGSPRHRAAFDLVVRIQEGRENERDVSETPLFFVRGGRKRKEKEEEKKGCRRIELEAVHQR